MRNRFYILLCVVLLPFGGMAQEIKDVQREGDTVVVAYELPAYRPASDRVLTLKPALCGATDTLYLEPLLVRGKRNALAAHREFVLSGQKRKGFREQEYIKARAIEQHAAVADTLRMPAGDFAWLLQPGLTLCLEREEEGCCRVEQLTGRCSEPYNPARAAAPADTSGVSGDSGISGTSGDSGGEGRSGVAGEDGVAEQGVQGYDTTVVLPPPPARLVSPRRVMPVTPTAPERLKSPVLHRMDEYKPYASTQVLSRDSDALYVHFGLDKVNLVRNYMNNAVTLDSIVYLIDQLMQDTLTEVQVIQIVGLASIEGRVGHNEWLAGERGNALKEYIKQELGVADSLFEVGNGGEAWPEMRWQTARSQFRGKQDVLNIIDTVADLDKREAMIRALNEGITYKYIRQNLLREQRNSGYIRVFYDLAPDAAGRAINRALELMQEREYEEALQLLLPVEDDPRAQNALGVALYMTGRREEGIRRMQRAAEAGDEEAKRNMERIKKQ
ncbi:MAG: hypothetical protein IJ169_04540 [Paludibacteraceae bacterium]|nr:hypothetical protein [Paludibacteraceae bacterium]